MLFRSCFDNINHEVLIRCIQKKIKDARLMKLIHKFLKAGYLEDFVYHNTYSGCPQGGIISPILANIYLHELDLYVAELSKGFQKPYKSRITAEYSRLSGRMTRVKQKIKKAEEAGNMAEKERNALGKCVRTLRRILGRILFARFMVRRNRNYTSGRCIRFYSR